MSRFAYVIRRLLWVVPTLLGITMVTFAICQFVPGGPVELRILSLKGGMGGGEGGASGGPARRGEISEAQLAQIRRAFHFDEPLGTRYYHWLVQDRAGMLSNSYRWGGKRAYEVIFERFRVSLIFGISGLVLTYLICIPLGIAKALREGSGFDLVSSLVVFTGYAIPAFAFGMLLKMLFCGTLDGFPNWLPIGGFEAENYAQLTFWQQVADRVRHMILPVICYVLGDFAVLTLLMKNSLMEQISADYVRTVLAKGGTVRRAIWRHALRNSLIPIVTGIGGVLSIFFAGAVLIEQVFEIPGMGKLGLEAATGRDYPVFMALMVLTSILGLVGNIMQDLTYTLVDPRINFDQQ